ncbi:MAG TPA: hypothetical protein VKT12_08885 [Candidatus Binataceae bacterium]|nr:hypothetical protein [Candidatus Binataceae bacterium]
MSAQYRLKIPIRAIYERASGEHVSVTLPTGAVLRESIQHYITLLGMVGVYWEGRHYSVSLVDLVQKAERVSTA